MSSIQLEDGQFTSGHHSNAVPCEHGQKNRFYRSIVRYMTYVEILIHRAATEQGSYSYSLQLSRAIVTDRNYLDLKLPIF